MEVDVVMEVKTENKLEVEEERRIPVIRSSAWDKPAVETDSPSEIKTEEFKKVDHFTEQEGVIQENKIVFKPATVDTTVQQLAERMRNEAKEAREHKGTGEAE